MAIVATVVFTLAQRTIATLLVLIKLARSCSVLVAAVPVAAAVAAVESSAHSCGAQHRM
jgi:hypothetical protein